MKKRRSEVTSKLARTRNRSKTMEASLCLLFILSSILVIWGIQIYRKTVAEPKYLIVIVVAGTMFAAVILLFVTRVLSTVFWTFFLAAFIGGGNAYFLTLFLNRELADKELTSETFDILETGNLGRGKSSSCGSPYAIVDFNGYAKQLVFYCEYEKSIHTFKTVRIEFRKGFFNFPVIQSQKLAP